MKTILIIILSFTIITVCVLSWIVIFKKSCNLNEIFNNKAENKVEKKSVNDLVSDPIFSKAVLLNYEGEYKKSHIEFERVLSNKSDYDNGLRDVARIYSASSLAVYDPVLARDYFKDIFFDDLTSDKNKAFSLLRIQQYSMANNGVQYLNDFIKEKDLIKVKDEEELLYLIDKKIYSLYKFPLSGYRIAIYQIKNSNSTSTINNTYNIYGGNIYESMSEMLSNPGLTFYAGNTMANYAKLSSLVEPYGLSTTASTTEYFESAYRISKRYSSTEQRQLIIMLYAEYLAKINKPEETQRVLKLLYNENIFATVKNIIKDKVLLKEKFPGIYDMYIKDDKVKLLIENLK